MKGIKAKINYTKFTSSIFVQSLSVINGDNKYNVAFAKYVIYTNTVMTINLSLEWNHI